MLCFCRITLSTSDMVSTERFNFVRVLAIVRLLYKFTGEEINPLFCQQQNPELFELFLRLHKNILSDKFKYKYKRNSIN